MKKTKHQYPVHYVCVWEGGGDSVKHITLKYSITLFTLEEKKILKSTDFRVVYITGFLQ